MIEKYWLIKNIVNFCTVQLLEQLLYSTAKQDTSAPTLPAIKVLFDWFILDAANFKTEIFRTSNVWPHLRRLLNRIQLVYKVDVTDEESKCMLFSRDSKASLTAGVCEIPLYTIGGAHSWLCVIYSVICACVCSLVLGGGRDIGRITREQTEITTQYTTNAHQWHKGILHTPAVIRP